MPSWSRPRSRSSSSSWSFGSSRGSGHATWIRRSCRPPIRWCSAGCWCFSQESSSATLDAEPPLGEQVEQRTAMYRLAHLSDPHLGPMARPRLRELANKRITGYFNWRRGRDRTHDMDLLDRLLEDMHAQQPNHIACTGDLINIGLHGEFQIARMFLEKLGPPDRVSFVPGNHDAYVRTSMGD